MLCVGSLFCFLAIGIFYEPNKSFFDWFAVFMGPVFFLGSLYHCYIHIMMVVNREVLQINQDSLWVRGAGEVKYENLREFCFSKSTGLLRQGAAPQVSLQVKYIDNKGKKRRKLIPLLNDAYMSLTNKEVLDIVSAKIDGSMITKKDQFAFVVYGEEEFIDMPSQNRWGLYSKKSKSDS